MNFSFSQPEVLWLLLLPGLLLLRLRRHAFPVSDLNRSEGAQPKHLLHRVHFWLWSLLIAAALLIFSASDPYVIRTLDEQESHSPDLLLALDISGSMEAIDWPENQEIPAVFPADGLPPSRLQTAKATICRLLESNPAERTALVAFAQQAYLVCPRMRDTRLLQARLESLQSEDFTDGTALGEAIRCGIRALPEDGRKRIMILFSDGADHSPESPKYAALAAALQGIRIYTVGIGGKCGYHAVNTDHGKRWEAVGELLDEDTLRNIAGHALGAYYHAADAEQLLAAIHTLSEEISRHTVIRAKQTRYALSKELLVGALLFLAAAAFFRYRAPLLQ